MSVNFLPNLPSNYISEWQQIATKTIDPTTPYTFWVYLINSEEQLLSDFLTVSDPTNSKYGQYYTYNQIAQYLVNPSIVTLIQNDILAKIPNATITPLLSGDILEVSATVNDVQNYFQTALCYYQLIKKSTGYTPTEEIIRVCNPTKPLLVSPTFAKYVEYVTPLNFFPYVQSVPDGATEPTANPAPLTGTSLTNYYYDNFTFPTLLEAKTLGIKQAFYTPLNLGGNSSPGFGLQDTALFVQNALGYSSSETQAFLNGDGPLELTESAATYAAWQTNSVTEPNLDIAMLLLMGRNIPTIQLADPSLDLFFDVGNLPDSVSNTVSYTKLHQSAVSSSNSFFEQIFSVAKANPTKTIYDLDLPQVISFSYAWHMNYIDPIMLIRINREIMKIGLLGITFLVSSGDSGPTIGTTGTYGNNDFSSLPSVTTVGYSYLISANPGSEQYLCNMDSSAACYASASGYSNIFNRQTYMNFTNTVVEEYINQPQVSSFLQNVNAKNMLFNPQGRAYPDLVGIGCNFNSIYVAGQATMGSGSSMAAPVVAGMMSIINYLRRQKGLPFLGYINQSLYQNANAMLPVSGSNSFAGASGFPYIEGLPYGPSGLGGCNFANLMKVFVT